MTTPDFTWHLLVIFNHLQVIFHHLQVIFHYLSGCLPATLKYSGTELLTHWLNWVMTPDFTWPHPDYYCSSSIAFQVIFHHLPGCLPLPGKYWVAESLLELSDWSSTTMSLRWYPNFEVVFQVIFHHLPCHFPSCLPSQSPGQLLLYLSTIISISILHFNCSCNYKLQGLGLVGM